jgi:tetratricopeptide (TPR) repeat protein
MSRIVISDDRSLENLDIRFDHLLLGRDDLGYESENFIPLESMLDDIPRKFFPSLLISSSKENAVSMLTGDDELELFFLIILGRERSAELLDKLRALKDSMDPEKYRDFLIFLFLHSKTEKETILSEIRSLTLPGKDGILDLILAAYDHEPHEIKPLKGAEYLYATYFEALKAEQSKDYSRAFSLMLTLFEKSGYHPFIFEVLKFYIVQYDGISPEQIELFSSKVTESPLTVPFSDLKFIEFLYYFRNNLENKLEFAVSALAESTDSVFILNVIAPLLYKYKKWHLIGKFYKLSAKKTTGPERTKYLELLADIYENKLDMPDFATEIHKNIVEDDPMSCSVSLSRVLSVYEENGMWSELFNLYNHLSGREEDETLKAYYFYKAGDVLHRELGKSAEAREYLEKSLAIKHSFEVVRTLSEIYLKMHDYDAYIKTLLRELEFSLEASERIRVLNIIAETYMNSKKDFISAQKYLLNILDIAPDHLPTIKKLGKIYYQTKSWKNLTEINFKEIDLTKDLVDTVNLYYRNGSIFFKELGDLERATECFMEILEIEPDHIPTLLYLEKIYLRKRDINNLIILYKRLLEQSHTDSETRQYYLTRLGIIYRDNNMANEAIDVFRTVLKMFPENIMAKENLRMLEGKPDFSESNTGDYIEKDLELFSDLIKNKDHSYITGQYLLKKEPSLWKYLYFIRKDSRSDMEKPQKPGHDEQFVISLLEQNYSIDNLIKNSSKKVALMLLCEKYLEEGYFRGIQTILKYYLKYEPENKRKIWSLFFRGYDNPELKEEFENILLSDSDQSQIEVVRDVLEKIYIKEGDYSTILFLRNLFIKKSADPRKKCDLIDSTIELVRENIGTEQLLELYKLRYNCTPEEEICGYREVYEKFLKSIGKSDMLTNIYELEWSKNRDTCTGRKCFDHYVSTGNSEKAIQMARDILSSNWDLSLFIKLIELLKNSGDINLAISDVTARIDNSPEDVKEQLKNLLLDLNLEAGYTHNALDLFNKTQYSDNLDRFQKGMKLANLMNGGRPDENSITLVRSLVTSNTDQAVEKLKFLFNSGRDLYEQDFQSFNSYNEILVAFDGSLPEEHKDRILKHFAEMNDIEAKKILINIYIKDGDEENAVKLIDSINPDPVSKTVFLSKLAWKNGEYQKEKELLKKILFTAVAKKEIYPLKRLSILEKDNRRLQFFLESVMKISGLCDKTDEELYPRIFAIDRRQIFEFMNFTQTELLLKEYLHITSFGIRDETKIPGKPLNSNSHRELLNLIEYIKLSANFDDLTGVFDDKLEKPFEIVQAKLPCICFGPSALKMNIRELKFKVIRNAFLLSCGMRGVVERESAGILAETIMAPMKLEGKEKVRFIKNIRPNFQNRLLDLVNKLENTDRETVTAFIEKLHDASFYHTFSLVPDIQEALDFTGSDMEHIAAPDSAFSKTAEFINNFFFQ